VEERADTAANLCHSIIVALIEKHCLSSPISYHITKLLFPTVPLIWHDKSGNEENTSRHSKEQKPQFEGAEDQTWHYHRANSKL
jgi:hypothetical protein